MAFPFVDGSGKQRQATHISIIWRVLLTLCSASIAISAMQDVDISQITEIDTQVASSSECNTYTSCTQCVSSPSPCDWCVDGNRCTHDTAKNCRNDILVTGVSRIDQSYLSLSGPSFCPRINSTSDGTNEILVPSGEKKGIRVKVHIIGQFIVQTRFVCQFNIEGRVTHVYAQLLADTIYCDQVEFTYTSRAPKINASLAVIWGRTKLLDNPDNTHILIYRCNDMADNCANCQNLPEKFGCGWCQASNSCEVQEQCGAQSDWLDRTQTCPNILFDLIGDNNSHNIFTTKGNAYNYYDNTT